MLVFFFQAEDGIRDRDVTGVQTCALPIYSLVYAERSMVVCCWNAPFARFDRSAYTSESDWGRRSSETVNPAGFPWITTRELSVCATNCAASSATGPVGGVRSAGISDLPSTSTIRMGATPPSRSYDFAPSPPTTIVSAPRRYRRAAAARACRAVTAASRSRSNRRYLSPRPSTFTLATWLAL